MTGIPIYNVNNNCSTGSSGVHMMAKLIEGGIYDCTLVVGFEKMEKGAFNIKFKIGSLNSLKWLDRV
jgi:sterol carrier protein 2